MARTASIQIEGRELRLSNLDKVYYPESGFRKGEVIDYYIRIAPLLLPHLAHRPLTLKRYPDEVEGEYFYEKQCPAHAPTWIKTSRVRRSDGSPLDYCVIHDLPSLVWATNLGNLELHPFLHTVRAKARPTQLMFDLDPGPPADLIDCCRLALRLRELFEALDLQSFPKTSGSKGIQLAVPLNRPVSYRHTKTFARAMAEALSRRFPEKVVADMKKSLRQGKVLIDWSQNDAAKTTVSVYSLRAKAQPTVSTPLRWEEVEKASTQRSHRRLPLQFPATELLRRVEKLGDLHAPVLSLQQDLPDPKRLKS